MFGKAISWVLNNPVIMLLFVFTVMFVMVVVAKNGELAEVRRASAAKDKRIETMVASLQQSRANVAGLTTSVNAQNASIQALADRGMAADARFEQLMDQVRAGNASLDKRITAIDKAAPGVDRCASALTLLKGAAQ